MHLKSPRFFFFFFFFWFGFVFVYLFVRFVCFVLFFAFYVVALEKTSDYQTSYDLMLFLGLHP